ncbi:Ser/Thr protein phosphatase family protein [Stachybotrys elegans]|uniref:Ser/Thr protein phosphatase family protein n=1 Tax=Stachybotrys elegans TaxID=80388 RepID=A0A8K0SGU4_9HYPO|nr:Ser/Thr protein phosphatase family protein [Stachybotrys elegans]
MEQQQNIRFLILSDTHDTAFPDPSTLPEADVLIHCGDLTMIGGLSNYRRALDTLAACPAEVKLVIAGNHDVSLDVSWWDENLESDDEEEEPVRAHALFTSKQYTSRGVRFLEEGTREVALSDGRRFKVFASQYTPAFGGYAFGYPIEEDHFNGTESSRIPDNEGIDVIVTHGPPKPSDLEMQAFRLDLNDKQQHLGCPGLWGALERVKPKLHCFGHIHEGYGAQMATFEKGKPTIVEDIDVTGNENVLCVDGTVGNTLLVNAAIMRHGEEEPNKPWIVNMSL